MKILIADDHALFRQGMTYILSEMNPDAHILEAEASRQAIQVAENNPDLSLILMDLRMPDMDGIDAMRIILSRIPTIPIVMLTASERLADMKQALDAGAMGYISKSINPSIMASAIKLVLSGGLYIPPALVQSSRRIDVGGSDSVKLTPRQIEVLRFLVDGQSNKQVARDLRLSEATVKAHISAIFKVLNVSNRTQAALVAKKAGLGVADENEASPSVELSSYPE